MTKPMRLLHAAFLVLAAAGTATAQEVPVEGAAAVSGSVTADLLSHYVWRGVRLSDGFAVQPSVGVESHGFSVDAWWNFTGAASGPTPSPGVGSSQPSGPSGLTETDLTLSYSRATRRGATVSAGVIYYGNRDAPDTTEVYAGVSRDMPLNPALTVYYDVDEGEGALALLSVSQDLALGARTSASVSAAASYNMNHKVMGTLADGEPFAGLYHGELGLAVSLPVGRRAALAPRLLYTFPLTGKAREAMQEASVDGHTSSLLSGGVSLVIGF